MARFASEVGERVRRRRKALGLSRARLSTLCGLSEDFIGLIERGVSVPGSDSLVRLADALRVPADALRPVLVQGSSGVEAHSHRIASADEHVCLLL